MNKPALPSILVCVPAYNEAANIEHLLTLLLAQSQNDFTVAGIKVYSDGSTDATVSIVENLAKQSPLIQIVHDATRRGKMFRLNQIFHGNTADFLVILDADIGLSGTNFLKNLVNVLIAEPKAVMVAAHQIPLRPKTFVGKSLYASFVLWDNVRLSLPGQDHVQNFYGAATAYRGSFASTLSIPEGVTEERVYIYLMAKKSNGFRYTFASDITYWPIGTMHDFLELAERSFGSEQPILRNIFGDQIDTLHVIPRKYKVMGVLRSLYQDPIYMPMGLILSIFLQVIARTKPVRESPFWKIAQSTKIPIQ